MTVVGAFIIGCRDLRHRVPVDRRFLSKIQGAIPMVVLFGALIVLQRNACGWGPRPRCKCPVPALASRS